MSMVAILITEDNLDLIKSKNTSLNDFDHEQLLKEVEENPLYFVPKWNEPAATLYVNWAMIPANTFEAEFDADMDKIKTEFVEITRKI